MRTFTLAGVSGFLYSVTFVAWLKGGFSDDTKNLLVGLYSSFLMLGGLTGCSKSQAPSSPLAATPPGGKEVASESYFGNKSTKGSEPTEGHPAQPF